MMRINPLTGGKRDIYGYLSLHAWEGNQASRGSILLGTGCPTALVLSFAAEMTVSACPDDLFFPFVAVRSSALELKRK